MKRNDYTPQRNTGNPNSGTGRDRYTRSRKNFFWSQIESEAIAQLVRDTCDNGRGLVLGRTSDGGALSVTVLDGDERIREWPASEEDFIHFGRWCATNFGSDGFDSGTPPVNPKAK